MAESKARPPAPPRPNQVRAAAKAGANVAPMAPRKPEAPKAPAPPVNAAAREGVGAKPSQGSSPRLVSDAPPAKPAAPAKPSTLPAGKGPPPLRKAPPTAPLAPTEPKKPLTSTAPLAPSAAPKLTSTAPLAPAAVDAAKTTSTETPAKKPLTSTAPLAPPTPGRPMRPSAPPPLPARATSKPAPVAASVVASAAQAPARAAPSAPALPSITATQSTPGGLGDQTVAEGSPAYAGPFDEDMEDAPTMATAAPEFEDALDEVLAARGGPAVDLGRTLPVESLRAQAGRFAPASVAPPSRSNDLADQTHTMVMPSAPPPPPAPTAPKFDEALFQAPSVTPRAAAAKAALPPFRPRIETADHFEPSGEQYVPDADLLWKPGEPASDVMPAPAALLHSRSAPTVQTHAVAAPAPQAPQPRASSFGDNEFWAPPPDYRGAVPTTGANVVAPDLMDASMRGQMSQSIGAPRSRIPASYAIVGAAVLATMLCVLAIAFSR